MRKKKAVTSVKLAKRFVASPSSGYSEEDAQIIGSELMKIAVANRVDVSSLDKELVFETVERAVRAGQEHSLQKFYDWDDSKAARAHRLHVTQNMIRGIRVIDVDAISRRETTTPIFVYVPSGSVKAVGKARSRVLTDDVLEHNPMFASAIGHKIRMVKSAVDQLAWLVHGRGNTSPEVKRLLEDLQGALDGYAATVALAKSG